MWENVTASLIAGVNNAFSVLGDDTVTPLSIYIYLLGTTSTPYLKQNIEKTCGSGTAVPLL